MSTRRDVVAGLIGTGCGLTSACATQRPSPSDISTETVTGPIAVAQLGFTLPHEHLFSSSAGLWRAWPEFFGGREQFIRLASEKLRAVKDAGVDTIVDLTTFDLGRDVRLMQEVSRRSGMQIVACTGHWHDPQLSMQARTIEELAEFFLREIQSGIEDTGIKAGVIKVAADREGITPFIERVFRAAARVSKATGVPIETHSWALPPIPTGPLQADLFDSEGLDPARVSIGHSDYGDIDYLVGLASRGYMIGMDHISRGAQELPPEFAAYRWRAKSERLKALIDAGYADRVLLSNDWLFADSAFATGTVAQLDEANPDGMLFVARRVIPYLQELGVSSETIRMMTVENPSRFFARVVD